MLADDQITQVLAGVAAAHERLDPSTWRAVLATELGTSFRLFVRRAGGFLHAELSPFLSLPDGERRVRLLRELLRRNRTLAEARFALDDDDTVVLEAVVDSTVDAFRGAIDSLLTAAGAHYAALSSM